MFRMIFLPDAEVVELDVNMFLYVSELTGIFQVGAADEVYVNGSKITDYAGTEIKSGDIVVLLPEFMIP